MCRVSARHARTTGLVSLALATLLVSLGCSDASATGTASEAAGSDPTDTTSSSVVTTCGVSVEAVNGKSCANAALKCTVPITCGAFEQQARCACTNGKMTCEDSTGFIPPGHAPRCVSDPEPDTAACPNSMMETQGRSCGTLGKTCYFPGALCPERQGARNLDYCRCSPDAGGKLSFECTIVPCNPMFAGTDGGTL